MMGRFSLLAASVALIALPPADAAAQSGGLEIRAGGLLVDSRRSATFEGTVGTGSGTLTGGELSLRHQYVGVTARLFGSAFSADSRSEAVGRIHSGDVRVLLGPTVLAGDIGYGRRAFTGAFGRRNWAFARIGARSQIPIGASGLSAELGVAFYAGVGGSSLGNRGSGREAETRLMFAPPWLPIYTAIGYRHARFTVGGTSSDRPEAVSGILLAAGVRLRL